MHASMQLPLLNLTTRVLPCMLGEVAREAGTTCQRCDQRLYALWQDTRGASSSSSPSTATSANSAVSKSTKHAPLRLASKLTNATFPACEMCPAHALCPGGSAVLPLEGFWHSSPNSSLMHPCPVPRACRKGYASLQTRLEACQTDWYASRELGAWVLARNDTKAALAAVVASREAWLRGAAGSAPGALNSTNTSVCMLWGVEEEHPLNYMSQQCVFPYTGNLCATCSPGYALDAELKCK